jgi:hypothetical protein
MRWVRLWLPLGIIAGGIVVIIATGASQVGLEGGMLIISAGLSVWLLNVFFRMGVAGDVDRDAEDEARRYYDTHGHWPDEEPPPEEPPPSPRADPHRRPPPADHDPHRPSSRPPRAGRRPPRRG